MACTWVHVCPDGVGGWWESSCGVAGNEPTQGWCFCPFCGEKLERIEGAKNTEQSLQPDKAKECTHPYPDMWIVVNIGCIECGVSSNIVGVFDSQEKAEQVAEKCGEKYNWREGGQNSFDVFPLPEANKINEEYNEIGI